MPSSGPPRKCEQTLVDVGGGGGSFTNDRRRGEEKENVRISTQTIRDGPMGRATVSV